MSTELEARYQKILGGFTPEERLRLPLDYTVYGETLEGLLDSLDGTTTAVDPIDLTPLYSLIRELHWDLNRQLRASELAPRERATDWTVDLELLADELSVLSAATHRRLLDEYFFLSNLLELMDIVRQGLTGRSGSGSFAASEETMGKIRAKLVEIFQQVDSQYERVQALVADNRS